MSRPPESRIEPLTEARLTDLRDWCDGLLNSPNTVRQRDGENLADLISEFEGLKANYQRVCGSLQELCQKHEVGRGGEYLDEIVVREYEREAALRARYEAALRQIADRFICTSKAVICREPLCATCIAREALAAAPEGRTDE